MVRSSRIMEHGEFICEEPEDTFRLGVEIGEGLEGGEAVLLSGPLGAGKTLFTKGVAEGAGFDPQEVNSPSFTLVNRYDARLPLFHIDLWRLEDAESAAAAVGLHDIIEDETAVVIIEWAERLGEFEFPGKVIRVALEGDGADPRKVTIEWN